jgi:pyruvate dehydrogenase E2 component (dihydrolipoamide acetyltransferase)
MATELRLPQLGDATTAARLGAWLKREGDGVTAGEPIVEVETDKTSVEIEAPASGRLQTIHIPAGSDGILVGALLATIAEAGAHSPDATSPRSTAEAAKAAVFEFPKSTASETQSIVGDRLPAIDARPVTAPAFADNLDADATPVARKIAQIAGLDLAAVQPSHGGRITKADVERALGAHHAIDVIVATSSTPSVSLDTGSVTASYEDRPLSTMRRVTAARLQQAKQTVPHFYLHADCRMDDLLEVRARWNASGNGAAGSATKVTITDILVYLAARALKRVPAANSAWSDGAIRLFNDADIAVAVNTPAGLITPVIRAADRKNIAAISRELATLAERARSGVLKPAEYSGGTFTLSNLGMYGVTSLVPIINPPQACILGVGAIEARPIVSNDAMVAGRVMTCTLAADHRALDGAAGAEFLATFRRFVEDPCGVLL